MHAAPAAKVATGFGVSIRAARKWMSQYRQGGVESLAGRSSRPGRCRDTFTGENACRMLALWKMRMTGSVVEFFWSVVAWHASHGIKVERDCLMPDSSSRSELPRHITIRYPSERAPLRIPLFLSARPSYMPPWKRRPRGHAGAFGLAGGGLAASPLSCVRFRQFYQVILCPDEAFAPVSPTGSGEPVPFSPKREGGNCRARARPGTHCHAPVPSAGQAFPAQGQDTTSFIPRQPVPATPGPGASINGSTEPPCGKGAPISRRFAGLPLRQGAIRRVISSRPPPVSLAFLCLFTFFPGRIAVVWQLRLHRFEGEGQSIETLRLRKWLIPPIRSKYEKRRQSSHLIIYGVAHAGLIPGSLWT